MDSFILRKYFNNGLRTLIRIQYLSKQKGSAYYPEVEQHLNRGRNQVSTILSKLEKDNLVWRKKHKRPQKIFLTPAGEELLQIILKELQI